MDFSHDMVAVDQPEQTLESRIIISGSWKLIDPGVANPNNPDVLLYDILKDPMETENLADEHPKVVDKLLANLDKWWVGAKKSK